MRKVALLALLPLAWADLAAADFSSCVADLKAAAIRSGVDERIVARALDGATQPDDKVVRLSQAQPEFRTPIWDYFGFLIDEARVEDGQRMMRRHGDVLAAAEQRFGVDRHVIAAVWGVESNYGAEPGDSFLPHALATLICETGRRTDFWRGELIAALGLVQRGDLELDELYGSWAGAFGQTQFIPSTYERLAVDFDGDGRRDLVNSVADALGSTANYLAKAGWNPGETWMIEVRAPENYSGPTGRDSRASMSTWGERGITRADGSAALGRRTRRAAASGGTVRAGLPRLPEFRCDLLLQPGGILRARNLASRRPARRLSGAAHGMADQRSRACRAPSGCTCSSSCSPTATTSARRTEKSAR